MSGRAASIGSILLGILIVIAAIPTGGASLTLGQFVAIVGGLAAVAGGVYGAAFSPKAPSPEGARAQELQIATASEGIVVPVIFGEQKVTGNFMDWRKENFRAEPRFSESHVGKGGGTGGTSTLVGYQYFLYYEYGLCMGPIDSIHQIYSMPGELLMRGDNPVAITFGSDDVKTIDDAATKDEGGNITVYKGSATQVRSLSGDPYVEIVESAQVTLAVSGTENRASALTSSADGFYAGYLIEITAGTGAGQIRQIIDYNHTTKLVTVSVAFSPALNTTSVFSITNPNNYRNVAWAFYQDFNIGPAPQPRTHQYIVRRTSMCIRDNGTEVTDIKQRGSANPSDPAYKQANPAAIIYEVCTNRMWGAELSSDLIHEDSFITASEFFEDNNIGMSFTMDQPDKLQSILDSVRLHLRTLLVWDGEQVRLKCLLDKTQTHTDIQTVKKSEITAGSFKFNRPLWGATINDLRAEFNDAERNYRPRPVHFMAGGNRRAVGRWATRKIQLYGFTDYNIVRRQLVRIIQEAAYPRGTGSFAINRFKSQLQVGDVFRLLWDEWSSGTVSYYFEVVRISESDSTSDDLIVYVAEDVMVAPVTGTETGDVFPDSMPWQLVTDIASEDTNLNTPPDTNNDEVSPVTLLEFPVILTKALKEVIWILGQRPNPAVQAMACYYKTDNGSPVLLGNQTTFALTGALINPVYTTDPFDRTLEAIRFSLTNAVQDETELLGNFNLISTVNDSLEDLIDSNAHFAVMGAEILQIGVVEKVGFNTYICRNIVRGLFGTPITIHLAGENIFFSNLAPAGIATTGLAKNVSRNFLAYPVSTNGVTSIGDPFSPRHPGDNEGKYLGEGVRPLAPSPVGEATRITTSGGASYNMRIWNATITPHSINHGADAGVTFGEYTPVNVDVATTTALPANTRTGNDLEANANGVFPDIDVVAVGNLTHDGTAPSNNDTVIIGIKTYTFKTALTPTEGEVLIGASADAALLNLIRAINHTGTPGTHYQCAAANTQVTADTAVVAKALTVRSIALDTAIVTTETSAHLAWNAATLVSGAPLRASTLEENASTILVKNEATGANNGKFWLYDAGSSGSHWKLRRCASFDASAEVINGIAFYVLSGTTNGVKEFSLTTANPITLNTTALTFTARPAGFTKGEMTDIATALDQSFAFRIFDEDDHDITTQVSIDDPTSPPTGRSGIPVQSANAIPIINGITYQDPQRTIIKTPYAIFVPEAFSQPEDGSLTGVVNIFGLTIGYGINTARPAKLRIYSVLNGQLSIDYAEYAI